MGMALYAVCFHSFTRLLTLNLPGIRIGRRTRPTSVVAYADDMIIFVTSAADFAIIEEAYMIEHQVPTSTLENLKPSR